MTKRPEPLPFWREKTLAEMSPKEWESLCDGCGRCCLNKFEDADDGRIRYTDVACKLLDTESCKCTNYAKRSKIVKDCIVLTPRAVPKMPCLPPTCAYRMVHEGKDLHWWHPLVSGRQETVREAGISIAGRGVVSEEGMTDEDMLDRLVKWPQSRKFPAKP